MSDQSRFWFGYLEADDLQNRSLVIYDQQLNRDERGRVLLYHLKRDEIVPYVAAIVRRKLRGLRNEELSLVSYAIEKYFPARSAWSSKQASLDSYEILEIKNELARDEQIYEAMHAGDRFKTQEDWAYEYLESNDSQLRDLGRMILRDLHGSRSEILDRAAVDAVKSSVAQWLTAHRNPDPEDIG